MEKSNGYSQSSMGKFGGSGGLQYHVSRPHPIFSQGTSSYTNSSSGGHYQQQTSGGNPAIHPRLAGEGDSQGDSAPLSSIFFQDVLGTQKEQYSKADNRSFEPQQDAHCSEVQDGECREDLSGHSRVFVGFFGGHNRRLPSCSVTLELPQIFRFCSGGKGVRLPETSLRPVDRSLGLYQGDKTSKKPTSLSRGDGVQLSGRLFDSGQLSSTSSSSHRSSDLVVAGARVCHKLGKVGYFSSTKVGISGGDDGSTSTFSFSSAGQNLCDFGPLQRDVGEVEGVEERAREPGRSPQFCGDISPSGKALSASHHQMDESSFFRDQSGCADFPDSAIWGASRSVAEAGVSESSRSHVLTSSIAGSHDGRFPVRMVRPVVTSQGGGGVGQGGGSVLDELERAEGYSTDLAPFCRSGQGKGGPSSVGQHDRLGVPETAGLSEVGPTLGSLEGDFGVVSGTEGPGGSGSSQGGPECPGGCRLPFVPDSDGVDPGQGDLQLDLLSSRRSSGGSVRHQGELPGEELRVSLSRSTGCGSGRLLSGLGSLGADLPLSSSGVSSGGGGEIEPVQGSGRAGGSVLESVQLVSSPVHEVSSSLPSSSVSLSVPGVLPGPSLSPAGGRFPASRLDAIKLGLSKLQFDDRTIDVVLCQHRNGTVRQYQSVWGKFLKYLDEMGVASSDVKLPTVLGFLSYHITNFNREYKTITGYKCALQFPLFVLLNLVIDCEVTWAFLRGFFNINPPARQKPMQDWCLSDLLLFLKSDSFEPLEVVSLKALTQKTLVLLLLASGRRIHEISAITKDSFEKDGRLFLVWPHEFHPKTDSRSFRPEFPSISRLGSRGASHEVLCPVRAWSICSSRFLQLQDHRDRPEFWPFNQVLLSGFFTDLIRASRVFVEKYEQVTYGTHQMRKLAASYCKKYLIHDKSDEAVLMKRMGCRSMSVLNRVYINEVPDLLLPCVVPLGSIVDF